MRIGHGGFLPGVKAFRKNGCTSLLAALLGASVLGFLFAQVALAQTFTVLHSFTGPPDGSDPITLLVDKTGNVYGTTSSGGIVRNAVYCDAGCGTAFTINPAGKERVMYAFAPSGVEKGYLPRGTSLVRDRAGNLYGTTWYGGNIGCNPQSGCGTVFKLSTTGVETVLYRFTGLNGDGEFPFGLTADAAGNLFGATSSGGEFGQGTVFKIDISGNETVLYSFRGGTTDGDEPVVGVALDAQGNIYGITFFGGAYGGGTIYEVSTTGVERVLYSFGGSAAMGYEDEGSLLLDAAGNIYGTTAQGGDLSCNPTGGCGVVYKLDPSGTYTVLYSFTDGADGAFPQTGLALDAAGNLYGTTREGGGTKTCGTVFKLSPKGTLTPLHAFTGCAGDDIVPFTAPVVDAAGNVYGTTAGGGIINRACTYGCGVVFKITP